MHVPIACFTCGKVIAQLWEPYHEGRTAGERHADICVRLGIRRMCCKRMLISHVDIASYCTHQKFEDTSDTVTRFRCIAKEERIVPCD
jgi:DNA-directed RNA polymerase subunit N